MTVYKLSISNHARMRYAPRRPPKVSRPGIDEAGWFKLRPPAAKKVSAAKPAAALEPAAAVKPIKTVFNKTTLVAHLVEQSGVEPKAAKAVLVALESAILGSVHKKGSGEFTLPGLMKIGLQQVPAKKKRFGGSSSEC